MLNIRSRGFERAQYCKFSKQIAKTFAKIINGYIDEFKTLSNISDPESCQTSKLELFEK